MSGFGFPSVKCPLFGFIVTHEGIETNYWVWSLARKLKILERLKLFRLVVTGVGLAYVSCCNMSAIQVARRDELSARGGLGHDWKSRGWRRLVAFTGFICVAERKHPYITMPIGFGCDRSLPVKGVHSSRKPDRLHCTRERWQS